MRFVYLHAVWFALSGSARRLGVSLRAAHDDRLAGGDLPLDVRDDQPEPRRRKREVLANQQWATVQDEDKQNVELLELSRQILELTKAVHAATAAQANGTNPDHTRGPA